jgi:hypothetical protein
MPLEAGPDKMAQIEEIGRNIERFGCVGQEMAAQVIHFTVGSLKIMVLMEKTRLNPVRYHVSRLWPHMVRAMFSGW